MIDFIQCQINRFCGRLELLFEDGCGPWLVIVGLELMVLAALCQGA
jgi:hypothetical protein